MELQTITLKNFRSYKDGTFTPAAMGDGITVITGENGVGKSSIIDALLWGLYGTTPAGNTVQALRRQGSEGEDVSVDITLRDSNQSTVNVVRSIHGKTTRAHITVNGEPVSDISAKTATSWVVEHFNTDAEAFLSAYVVRQKELDALVTARPAERRKIVERLAGIDQMTEAVKTARTEKRDAEKLLDAYPEPEKPVDAIQKDLTEAQTLLEEATREQTETSELLTSQEEAVSAATTEIANLQTVDNELRELNLTLTHSTNEAARLEQEVARLETQTEAANELPERQQTLQHLEQQQQKQQEAARLNTQYQNELANLESDETAATAVTQAEKNRDNTRTKIENIKQEINKITTTPEDVTEAEKALADLRLQHGLLENERTTITEALHKLANHPNSAECPTCLQQLPSAEQLQNEHNTKLATLETELAAVKTRGIDLRTKLSTLNEDITTIREHENTLHQQKTTLQRQEDEVERLTDHKNTLQQRKTELQNKLANLDSTPEIDQTLIDTARRNVYEAETAVQAQTQLATLQTQLTTLQTEITTLTNQKVEKENIHNPERLVELTNQIATMQTRVAELRTQQAQAASMVREHENAVNTYTWQLKQAQDAHDKRIKGLEAVELAAATANALEDFRKERLAALGPELSEIGSDIISTISNGSLVAMELDDEFTPMVTVMTGEVRPASWLSGGEESLVALALRIAIGEVLSGGSGGLLVLDEVLTAQDDIRRASAMKLIRELPRQIIAINHIAEATDIGDRVIELAKVDAITQVVESVSY